MDAIQFLKKEHVTAKAAFGDIVKASPTRRGGLWKKLAPELEAHEKIEETCLYAPLAHEAEGTDAKLAGWREKHEAEVDKVKELVGEIGRLDPEEEKWLTTVKKVHTNLKAHIHEEEGDIFPRIKKVWDEARLKKAGANMKQMKTKKAAAA
jgi:hemerythrin-like domain-containing protein